MWLSVGMALVILVIGASLMPHLPNMLYFRGSDKVWHFAAYITVTFWFGQIYKRNRVRLTIALTFVTLGISLEYLQRLSSFRTFEYADMAANAAGVFCALFLAQTPLSKGLAFVEKSLLRLID